MKGLVPVSLLSVFVGLLMASAALPISAVASPATAVESGVETLSSSYGISYTFYDFFNVPYGEYWDYRFALYGDKPIGADCFNQTAILHGICAGTTYSTYPYTNWIPWYADDLDGFIYAPYRVHAAGVDSPAYTADKPVLFPTFGGTAVPGTSIAFSWRFQYIDFVGANDVYARGCVASNPNSWNDGYVSRTWMNVTTDFQTAKNIFGVVATTPVEARSWWTANTKPGCSAYGLLELKYQTWLALQGGSNTIVGPYDILNTYEYWYAPFWTNIEATVADDGTTSVSIDHGAWGMEALMARWFYWGSTYYIYAGPDGKFGTTDDIPNAETLQVPPAGWWGMELAWMEDFTMTGTISTDFDFDMTTVLQYHFSNEALPGPDGTYITADDVPTWVWMAALTDYIYGGSYSVKHPVSELDRYAGPDGYGPSPDDLTYLHTIPGSVYYGKQYRYDDLTPIAWNLKAGDSMTFEFPTGQVVFYEPYLSPWISNPATLVPRYDKMLLRVTDPSPLGTYDPVANTFTITGPLDMSAPPLPLKGYPWIELAPWSTPIPPSPLLHMVDLVAKSAWPEHHHFDISKDEDGLQNLYGLVANLGVVPAKAIVVFQIYDEAGALVDTVSTDASTIPVGEKLTLNKSWLPTGLGRFSVKAQAWFDSDDNGIMDTTGSKVKSFGFAVVQ